MRKLIINLFSLLSVATCQMNDQAIQGLQMMGTPRAPAQETNLKTNCVTRKWCPTYGNCQYYTECR